MKALLATISLKGAVITAVPPRLLAMYSPEIARKAADFAALTTEEKRSLIGDYAKAVTFFAGKAYARVHGVAFADAYESFAFADVSHLDDPKDPRSLAEFLEAELAGPPATWAGDRGAAVIAQIDAAIASAKAACEKPVIVMDLDGTLYSGRNENALHAYDAENGTSVFANVEPGSVPDRGIEEWLYAKLAASINDTRELITRVNAVKEFCGKYRFDADAPEHDTINTALRERVATWVKSGAEILNLTARAPRQAAASQRALDRDGIPGDLICLDEGRERVAGKKMQVLASWKTAHPGSRFVGFVDNDRGNIDTIKKALPDVPAARAYWNGAHDIVLTDGSEAAHYAALLGR